MRLRQLTGLEQDKLRAEYEELMKLIEHLKALLADVNLRTALIKEELIEIREKYGDARRSLIEYSGGDVSIEDLIADENVVITISHAGYIKRTNLTEYKTQNRGGVGQKSAGTRDQDFLEHMYVATNHQYMMFFTQKGKCFWMRVYEIPEGSKTAKGRALQNLINIESDDKVKAFICTQDLKDKDYTNSHNLIMVTKKGQVKKTSLDKYSKPRVNGVAAITIKEGDELLGAKLTNGESQVLIAGRSGKMVRFEEYKTRPMGRTASGVRGITLKDETDEVIGIVTVDKENVNDTQILVVTENGYGKRTKLVDDDGEDVYRITNRGGKGVKTLNITEKTGALIAINNVTDADDLMIINKSGLTIRMAVEDLRVMGRATQGVKLINIKGNDSIAAVTKVMKDDVVEVVVDEDGNIIENEAIERVKPVLEILEDEGGSDDDDDDDSEEEETEEEDSEDESEDESEE
jgi:DNA gyrase subunit A